jgi:low affinity Fe/Cu permease
MESNLPVGRPTPSHSNGNHGKSGGREIFRHFANATAGAVGSPMAFVLAALAVVVWACLGPHNGYSDTWQLVINTSTTIVTFLMVFLIQNTQNRDARAIHLKLDELIKGNKGARNRLVDLEECTDEEIAKLEEEFRNFRKRNQHRADSSTATAEETV